MRAVFKFPSQGKGTFALRKDVKVMKDTVCSVGRDPENLFGQSTVKRNPLVEFLLATEIINS